MGRAEDHCPLLDHVDHVGAGGPGVAQAEVAMDLPRELVGKKVLVVGLARSGVAAAKLCATEGARVTVTDRRSGTELVDAVSALGGAKVTLALAGHDRAHFTGADLVVLSPGVPMALPEIQAAKAAGGPRVAALLNVTPDHLDRYKDIEEYAAAKGRIFMNQDGSDTAVANLADRRALTLAQASRAQVLTFGLGAPQRLGACGEGQALTFI